MIQQQTYGLAAGTRGGKQHERDLPVVELRAIRIPGMYGSFEAARTVLQVAGVALMAIENGDADAVVVRQCLVPLQLVVDMGNPPAKPLATHQSVDGSDRAGAACGLAEPVVEEAGASGEFQSVKTAHPCPEQNGDGLEDDGRRNTRLQAPVDNAGDNRPGETEDLLGICDQAAEDISASLTESASTPTRKPRPADAESPGTRRPPPGPGPATPSVHRSGVPCPHGFAQDTTTGAPRPRRNGKWVSRTWRCARTANRAGTVRRRRVGLCVSGGCARRRRVRRD